MAKVVKASPFALSKMYFLQHKNRCIYFAISESNVKCILQNKYVTITATIQAEAITGHK